MNTKQVVCMTAIVMLVLGCSPSAEQIATMTAAAWTPTPAASPTPTPIPYGLTVHIADQSGAPIAANIVVKESGSDKPVQADASGSYAFPSLKGPDVNLQVSAPGYYAAAQPVTLQRGPNEMVVILQGDPLGLAAADACAPDETLLYVEDFQSGQAADWRLTTGDPSAWSVAALADGNRVLSLAGVGLTQVEDSGLLIDNAVLRLRVLTTGMDGDSFINLKHSRSGGDTRYIFQWGADPFLVLTRFDGSAGSQTKLSGSEFQAKPGRWQYLELSTYRGTLQAWANGKKVIDVTDPAPLHIGGISLEAHINADPDQAYLFDNIAVCELSAPFSTSLYEAPTQ